MSIFDSKIAGDIATEVVQGATISAIYALAAVIFASVVTFIFRAQILLSFYRWKFRQIIKRNRLKGRHVLYKKINAGKTTTRV